MSLELRQQVKQIQKLAMTPQLQQAIKLLQLTRMELLSAVQLEMEQNPMLEEEISMAESSNPEALSAEEVTEVAEPETTVRVAGDGPAAAAEVNWEDYANTFDADLSFAHETPPADAPSRFDFLSTAPGLRSFLEWQLSHLALNERDLEIARFILGNLDGHGFFAADLADICAQIGCSEAEAEDMLRLVQNLDPPGIAARNIRESLLLQLERQDMEDHLAYRIVAESLEDLQAHNFAAIARKSKCTAREAEHAAGIIATLTPYPGNAHSNEQAQYIVPDVYVDKIDGEFVVQLNYDGLPRLQLSAEYQKVMHAQAGQEAKNYLQTKQRSAVWFIHSVHYRQSTLFKVAESIVKFQHEFLEKGRGSLKPLILADVAKDVGLHESTVSRATANKYMHTPQGIYELKYFFSTVAASSESGEALTGEAIRNQIAGLVRHENPARPLSDSMIAELLKKEGIDIARRTVAKYREQMKILPAKHRRLTGSAS